ncbi:hypothetical protein A2686_02040 [Candidatus Woesebacteria bacterium RIFCSPHIGHO2_01_FULL_38_10]|uniref:Uncharacterized protein n=1 Tax=Candidatus Woesebacteria bacterium RIFCSPLOWO2_01_FULL_39_10b TaxID=1802517 RepID=A0A1F8BBN5_9BACT|nr:MAG: hypothetical protein A2686_02040 [Candidatus Woesebacteria bacterium RIFCSPHIGHO2_01_FULL_38_10]OGM60758.1 MAG: hypothetical protein A2892_01810 [Candidatus Woesebacteria bacterium RIFCSPLOWO2_01_FULL_39_10b]
MWVRLNRKKSGIKFAIIVPPELLLMKDQSAIPGVLPQDQRTITDDQGHYLVQYLKRVVNK